MFCNCIDVYKTNECDDNDKMFGVLSKLKNEKFKS